MASNEVYSPPEAKVEDKLHEPKARKFVMGTVDFLSSYLGNNAVFFNRRNGI